MKSSFFEWLQDYLLRSGLVGLVEGVLAIMAFAGAASALVGVSAIKTGAAVAVIIGVLGLVALLFASRFGLLEKTELCNRLVARYCALMIDQCGYSWRICRWVDTMLILPNGTTRETITVSAIAECDRMDFFKIYAGSGWPQPERHRKSVRAKVRTVKADGVGTRPDVTLTWSREGKLQIIGHFYEPVRRGGEVNLQVELDWPGRCAQLMRRHTPEEFAVNFTHGATHFEYRITLPAGVDVYYNTIGFVDGEDNFQCTCGKVNGGEVEIRLVACNVGRNKRAGLLLELG